MVELLRIAVGFACLAGGLSVVTALIMGSAWAWYRGLGTIVAWLLGIGFIGVATFGLVIFCYVIGSLVMEGRP